jgi:hypothetical protein
MEPCWTFCWTFFAPTHHAVSSHAQYLALFRHYSELELAPSGSARPTDYTPWRDISRDVSTQTSPIAAFAAKRITNTMQAVPYTQGSPPADRAVRYHNGAPLHAMEIAAIILVAAKIFPSETGGGNALSMSISGRHAPIETWHGVTSLFLHGISAGKTEFAQPGIHFELTPIGYVDRAMRSILVSCIRGLEENLLHRWRRLRGRGGAVAADFCCASAHLTRWSVTPRVRR